MKKPRTFKRLPRGTTLFEVIVAIILLGAGMAMTGQVFYSTSQVRRESQRRQCALQEAANALEYVRAMPWSELSASEPPTLELSSAGERQLPEGRLTLRIEDRPGEANEPTSKHVVVEVNWLQRNGQPAGPVRLSSWRFSQEDSP